MNLTSLKKYMHAAVLAAAMLAASPVPGNTDDAVITNVIGMTFVKIGPGGFMMGSPHDEPHRNASEAQHKVYLSKSFYMQTTEVTLAQWRAVMGSSFFDTRKGADEMPVVKVSWFDAQDFIEKLNERDNATYRLPTEAEWEYAARAGTTTPYPWGSDINCRQAMFSNNPLKSDSCVATIQAKGLKKGQPAPVGSYAPNAWGLYDMQGNVWEWVSDWYAPYDTDRVVDPTGPYSGDMRVKRGGSWFKYGHYCRSANRASGHPASRYRTTGFRVVRIVPGE
jgi:sulfatase modifying factor 1